MTRTMFVTISALAGLIAVGALPAHAGKAKSKSVRTENAELKGKIVQLQTQADFQMRDPRPTGGGVPVGGLCTDPCTVDSDNDGSDDCKDLCPCDPNTADTDADGVPDCADPCPNDATDDCINPCKVDSDGDGSSDCTDPCPWDPSAAKDADRDGIPDCADPCPEDKTNRCIDDRCSQDSDGDSQKDCTDPCPWGEGPNSPCKGSPNSGAERR
jgi:hypothetical protein